VVLPFLVQLPLDLLESGYQVIGGSLD
jgi:hypothetical protein